VLAPLLAPFAARHPRVRVEVDLSMRITDLVQENFDLAIRLSQRHRLSSSTLVAKRLSRLDLGLYAGTTYLAQREPPRRAEDLNDHELVLFSGRDGKDVLQLEGPRGAFKLTVKGRTSANDFFFIREALASGSGIGMLPWFVAKNEVAAGRLTRVLADHRLSGVTAYLVHPPSTAPSAKMLAFRDFLLEQGPALLLHP
jgi:DNA-binding transcriptional LysR family regulator